MENNPLFYKNFFGHTDLLTELFESVKYPWEVLGKITEFIDNFEHLYLDQGYEKVRDGLYIGKNVEIDDTAKIKGMAIVGHNSVIGHAAFLRGDVVIGDNVNVGHATEVKHSIVLSNTALAHLNYIGDSVVGSNCNISGGATLANWRFDHKNIVIKNGNDPIDTQMEKLGGIVGDGTSLGVHSILNPGTILAKNSLVFPLIAIKGVHLDSMTFK